LCRRCQCRNPSSLSNLCSHFEVKLEE
jgi:hypothetical protein